jgi:hypothetical protein
MSAAAIGKGAAARTARFPYWATLFRAYIEQLKYSNLI